MEVPKAAPMARPTPELLARYDVAGPRYTSYPTVPEWSDKFGPADAAAALERGAAEVDAPLSVYVHIPFCEALCSFCGCNVLVSNDPSKGDRYVAAVRAELAQVVEKLGSRRKLGRLHLGGGTPTWLSVSQLEQLGTALLAPFELTPDAELAVEVDPVVTRVEQLALLRRLGWNRLSMGVQDFDPKVQQAVRRIQSYDGTRALIESARELGFGSVNVDLIYGLPHQTESTWRATLELIGALRPDRIAAFSLAYLPDLRRNQRVLEAEALPTPSEKLNLCFVTHDVLAHLGYCGIGMDHFALPHDELSLAQANGALWRDFQGYTTRRADDTVGLGVSAIGFVGGAYMQSVRGLGDYLGAVAAKHPPVDRGIVLTEDDKLRRRLITELMCNLVVRLTAEEQRYLEVELADLAPLARDGLVEVRLGEVRVTPVGKFFVRNVAMVFDAYLRKQSPERRTFSRTV